MKIKDLNIGNSVLTKDNKVITIIDKVNKGDIFYKISINGEKYENFIDCNILYELITNNYNTVLTHNCAQRLVCGQLGSVASRMALDDNQATTIDGTHKGAGMVKSQGQVTTVQYYFEQQSWLFDTWFAKRGLTKKGYEPWEDPNAEVDPSTINLGEDEEITLEKNKTEIDFNGIHKEIDNTKDQKFEQV